MLRFYWRLVRRTPPLLWRALRGLDTATGVLTLVFGAVGFGAWQQLLPWWTPFAAFGLILFYGFLRTNHDEYLTVEGERDRLRRGRATAEKRIAVKNLLVEAAERGEKLKDCAVSHQEIVAWVDRTHDLIESAFDKGVARSFVNGGSGNIYRPPDTYALGLRLKCLHELNERADSLKINPRFDPQDWSD